MRKPLIVACLVAACLAAPTAAPASTLLDEALQAILMTRDDLTFRTDYADSPDSFRTSVVDSLLEHPLDTESYVVGLADSLGAAAGLADSFGTSAGLPDHRVGAARLADIVEVCWSQLRRAGRSGDAGPEGSTQPGHARETSSAPPNGAGGGRSAAHPLDALLSAAHRCARDVDAAFARLTDEERAFVAEHAAVLLEEEEFDPDKPIDVRDREAERDEKLGDELLRIAAMVDYGRLQQAAMALAAAVDEALPQLMDGDAAFPAGGAELRDGAWSGDVVLAFETDIGAVVVGGPGPTEYREPCALIVDTGGDDVYSGGATGAAPGRPASVIIDLSGDDTYSSNDNSAGAGFMGVGILVDVDGDDSYASGNFSQGSGLFGTGILLDEAGNDRYFGDTCTQASGAFGVGALVDRSGNDSYEAAVFSQAFGFVAGAGALVDGAGNDVYRAGGKYTDEIRYFDHYISLSQGFGFGWRPDASGGVGLLLDEGGNDIYVSDIFGQGASYWFSVGGLVDRSGNDQYVSYQYAQGAATHITVAALVDEDGDDNYVSKGVSQGCGHDLAIGILHDLGGDDNYVCHDLSQGAGNANGIGLIVDDSGDDSYSVRDANNTHGYGNLRRDYGSVGIMIDGGGTDRYSGRGADGTWWIGSTYGIGIDSADERGGAAE